MDAARLNFMGQEITGEKLNCRGCNYPQGEIGHKLQYAAGNGGIVIHG